MIAFVPASPLPRELTESDLRRLGLFLGRILRKRSRQEVGVRFVPPSEIRRLNRTYRKIDRPTDVLSFNADDKGYLGDLVVCPSYAKTEAKRRGLSAKEELLRLLAHGVLHLCGYDHATPRDESRMFALQERAVEGVLAA